MKTSPPARFVQFRHVRHESHARRSIISVFAVAPCALAAAFLFLFSLALPANSWAKPVRVVTLTDAAGLGDKGFNDVCWQGVQKAKKDLGVSAQFIQSREQADYASNLVMAAGHADIVVTLGYLQTDAVKQVAPQFPAVHFIHVEGDVQEKNVASFDFKSEEGGFLAGLTAGLFTKSRKVGVVSGMDIPPVEAYVSGFLAGVKTAEKRRGEAIETIEASAGSFNDPVKGKSLAMALSDKGVDVIFRAAGNTGVGVVEAARDVKGLYVVGEDLDQDADLPGKILASVLKRMDVAVYNAILETAEGKFQAGHRWLGTSDGAIGISDMKYSAQLFKPEDLEAIRKARDLLKENKFTVPKTRSQAAEFAPPVL